MSSLVYMFIKALRIVSLLIMLGILIPSLACAFTYNSQTQTVSQTIRNVMSQTLRPDGAGSSTDFTAVGDSPNWRCVDETSADGDATYVRSIDYIFYRKDLYTIQDHSGSGAIKRVTVWIRSRASTTFLGSSTVKTVIRTYSTNYLGNAVTLTTSYTDYSTIYATNPNTGSAWTWPEIDSLQIGLTGLAAWVTSIRCTQVWLVIEYTNA